MKRITRDKLYTEIAKLFSQRSTCGRLQVGCVITRDGRIIASGYKWPLKATYSRGLGIIGKSKVLEDPFSKERCGCNLNEPCTKSIHAEANAISFAARNGIILEGTTMYCTHSPCLKCAELIIQAGVEQVIFIEHFRDADGLQLLIANNVQVAKHEEQEY